MILAHRPLFFCQAAVSMRKSFEGLCAIVEALFPEELLSDACFIFLNRSKDHMKVLYWDGDGFAIWYKRLEKVSVFFSVFELWHPCDFR